MKTRVARQALHAELQTQYPAFFESKLAVTLVRARESLPALKQVSEVIGKLLAANIKELAPVEADQKIRKELYDARYFGRLIQKSDSVLADMLAVLTDDQADLDQVMQVHSVFTYRLYPLLNPEFAAALREMKVHSPEPERYDPRKTVLEGLFPAAAREKLSSLILDYEGHYKPTPQLGILKAGSSRAFFKLVGQSTLEHGRAVDRFVPAGQAPFFKSVSARQLPFVAGPSGHTASLMRGARFYGLKTVEELQQYALAIFGFLGRGGNHSYHEVMFAAKEVCGLPHDFASYDLSLSEAFKKSSIYRDLQKWFPEYLEARLATVEPAPISSDKARAP